MERIGDPEGITRIRKALLSYCKQDTLGMAEIVKKMGSLAGS